MTPQNIARRSLAVLSLALCVGANGAPPAPSDQRHGTQSTGESETLSDLARMAPQLKSLVRGDPKLCHITIE